MSNLTINVETQHITDRHLNKPKRRSVSLPTVTSPIWEERVSPVHRQCHDVTLSPDPHQKAPLSGHPIARC